MANDQKYLQRREETWYLRISHPPKHWGLRGEFICSLGTGDLQLARRLRDRYVMPLMAEDSAADLLKTLAQKLTEADERWPGS